MLVESRKDPRGHRLRMARYARRIPQGALARAAGISQKHLCQLEQGYVNMGNVAGKTLYSLAKAVGLSVEQLLRKDQQDPEDR